MEERIRVFIVDDHEMVRVGLRRMLELEEDLEVVGDAASAEEALGLVEALSPHVILMDIKMPNVNGLDATRHLKSRGLQGEVIVLSLYDKYLAQAIEAGATGYLVKDVKREELVDAIRRAAQGNLVLGGSLAATPDITERTIGYLQGHAEEERCGSFPRYGKRRAPSQQGNGANEHGEPLRSTLAVLAVSLTSPRCRRTRQCQTTRGRWRGQKGPSMSTAVPLLNPLFSLLPGRHQAYSPGTCGSEASRQRYKRADPSGGPFALAWVPGAGRHPGAHFPKRRLGR